MKFTNTLIISAILASPMFATASPVVIDDNKLSTTIGSTIGKLVEAKQTTSSADLAKQLSRKTTSIDLPKMLAKLKDDLYGDCVGSVGVIASVYKCTRCPNWHKSSLATAWVLTEDGVMISNYHVFAGKKDHPGFGVMMRDGTAYPVTEVLAANKEADIAIFRVKAKGLKPLPLRSKDKDQKVGKRVHIIGHPDSRFFTYTSGNVSRYWLGRGAKAPWMSVTAEFARGSSGGPVLDDYGNVCGMVANTRSIYSGSKKKEDKGSFQMCIKNCVPVDSIHKLIAEAKKK